MNICEKIKKIFDVNYHPDCHPSREDDIKCKEAILLLAEEIDYLISMNFLRSK